MAAAAAVALFLFLSAAISASAQEGYTNIFIGSSLTPNTNPAWLSSSRIFAFGFYQTPDGFAICVFLACFKENTVVWTANSEDPIVPENVVLQLTIDGLILMDSQSQRTLSRVDNSSQPIGWASMLDNGNFVLHNSNGSVVWQTFDHPTDSLLSGQTLLRGGELLSRASEADPRKGIFRLWMQFDANLVMYYVYGLDGPGDSYYSFSTYGIGKNVSLNLGNDSRLYLADGWSDVLNITEGGNPVVDTIYLVRLDWDGILRLYNRSLHEEDDWKSIWSVTDDRCLPKGLCGFNSFCSYTNEGEAHCSCIPGFGSVQSGQWSAGCSNNFMVDCSDKNQSSKYEMTVINNVNWEDNYYSASRGITAEHCKQGCLEDCNCIVAFFTDGECRKQKLPLSYGRWSAEVSDMAFVRVIKSENRGSGGIDEGPFDLGGATAARKMNRISTNFYSSMDLWLQNDTADGQLVAVKVLNKTHDNAEEFINEVASISRTSHVNIVNLLGFCYDRKKRALVYEYMPNQSLDKFMYKNRTVDTDCSLDWKKLYEIAVGVAQGLEYLHRGCNTRIVHFDIKPQNILLDEDFCPKISDFGLAKLCVKKQSKISILGTRGTLGYIAPEVFSRKFGVVSHKSDVYSYGIMLLQMAEARTNVEIKSIQSSENYFLERIYKHVLVQNEKIHDLVTEEEEAVVRKMLMVGFWCIQTAPLDRPSMNTVVDMLKGDLQSIKIPPVPFLLSSPKPQDSCLLPVIVETLNSTNSYC